MDQTIKRSILAATREEPMARTLGMTLVEIDDGYAAVEMTYRPETMNNLFGTAHGGAIFALLDEAFQVAAQTVGGISVALNVNVTYLAAPESGDVLRAVAKEISGTRKTATYELRVTDPAGQPIAAAQAVAYRTGKPLPFIDEE